MRAAWLAAALLACTLQAGAQPACPLRAEVTQAQLQGLWRAEFEGRGHAGTLLIEQHPVHAQSFRGAINRNGQRSLLAGDIEDGIFTMEESADGVHIAAAWLGEVVEGSCGRQIRGTWYRDGESTGPAFVLRKP